MVGEPESRRSSSRLGLVFSGAIILLLLVGASFFVLLPACGIKWSEWPWLSHWCTIDSASARSTDDLDRESAALEAEIAALERDIAALRCEAPPKAPPPEVPAEVPVEEPPPVEPEERAAEEPEEQPKEEVAEEPEPPKEEEIAKVEHCEPEQTAKPPEELVIVVDTSTSMSISIDLPKNLEDRYNRAWKNLEKAQAALAGGDLSQLMRIASLQSEVDAAARAAQNYPGESRISVARKITTDAIDKAPADLPIGLVSFNACKARPHGTFAPPQRERLKSIVRGLRDKDSTPLALAVSRAAASIKGGATADDPVNIIVISDGQDSCRGDPCRAAREAKRKKPGLVINVVDLSSGGAIKCMADQTGGFYRQKREGMNIDDLARSVREGAGYEGEGLCRDEN